jgi:WD40 repeat protein
MAVAFAPDGRTLATASFDRSIRLWDVSTGKPLGKPLTGHAEPVTCLAFSPDGKVLASGSLDNSVKLWDPATGHERATLFGHTSGVNALAFAPGGKALATAGFDRTARLWDLDAGQETAKLEGFAGAVRSVAWSPDGRWVATGAEDKTLRLWDASGKGLGSLPELTEPVFGLAFTPDSREVVSAGGQVRLWDVETRQERATLPGLPGWASCVAVSRDGKTVVAGSYDGSVMAWEAAP